MPGITDTLQQKLGPAPAWVWILGGGVVLYMLPKVTGIFGGSPQQTPSSKNPPNLGVPPGWVPAGSAPAMAPTPVNNAQTWRATTRGELPGWPGIPISADTNGSGQFIGWLPSNSQVTLQNKSPVLGTWGGLGQQNYYQVAVPGGGSGYVLAKDLSAIAGGIGGGIGGGRGGVTPSVGSRSANLMSHFHPQIKQPVRYPHYHIAGKGGPSTVHAVARSTGLHPARIMAVNSPHVRGQIPHGHMIRIS